MSVQRSSTWVVEIMLPNQTTPKAGAPQIIARFLRELQQNEDMKYVTAQNARESCAQYIKYVTRGFYKEAPHTKLLCKKLESIERGELKRLMVFMPPRHSKSETTSKHFPGWFLGRNPQKRVILGSYGRALARDLGRRNRDDLEEYGKEIFGISVSPSSKAADRWDIAGHRGGMIAAGVSGPMTGRGADLFIIDDPFKDWQAAQSPVIRERVWDWYRSVAYTRLQEHGAIIVIQTRWHENDLSGRLIEDMKAGGEQWDIVNLPAEAETDDLLGRQPGEPLWPDRGFDQAWLATTRRTVGPHIWAALYQQRPSPADGGIFKRHWWKFWHHPGVEMQPVTLKNPDGSYQDVKPEPLPKGFDRTLQSWDMAFKDSKTSAYVCGQVWGRHGANKYLLDQTRDKLDFVKTITEFERVTLKWPKVVEKLVEEKANGAAVIASLRQKISGIIPIEPEGSKVARAHSCSPEVESGNVYLPHPSIAPWVWEFIEECTTFPNGSYADQVDTMTQALRRFSGTKKLKAGLDLNREAGHRANPWNV